MRFDHAIFATILFAQVTEATSWVQVFLQLGSLGILGYFLLKVQPECARSDRTARMEEIRLLVSVFAGERSSFAERAEGIEAEMKLLREAPICKLQAFGPGWFRNDPPSMHEPHRPGES